ncbi:MAG: TrkA family potassium uptake protein [Pseudohongiellaceae bacterium]
MKFLNISSLIATMKTRNIRSLLRFFLVLTLLVFSYGLIFQLIMALEKQSYSWIAGIYWALSTMSTLGYGDITFHSDLGRLFSIIVLLSGIIFMIVLLPVTFIQSFYEPWMAAQAAAKIPKQLKEPITGHVILTFYGPVVSNLIPKLDQFNYPYVVVLPEAEDVVRLRDSGIHVIQGNLNDPETFIRARVEDAAMVATTRSDIVNTSVVFTVRGLTSTTPVIATARNDSSVEVLKLAGCNRVLNLSHIMAEALARRAIGGTQFSHVVGNIDDLVIAEIDASRTTLVGMDYRTAQRETSVSIVGFWARGHFEIGEAESIIEANTVLVMAGSRQQIKEFDLGYRKETYEEKSQPVIIIGGGRVGRETAKALKRRKVDSVIIEQLEERIKANENYILGSGADRKILEQAGINTAATIIITTGKDETNIYLTILCRLLQPNIQIICRSTAEMNVAALHRAGSDIVMSYASMGSNSLFNLLKRCDLLMIAEGLDVFKMPVPDELIGISLGDANIRSKTTCSVIGIDINGKTLTNPSPSEVFPAGGEIILIGSPEGETAFLKLFPTKSTDNRAKNAP